MTRYTPRLALLLATLLLAACGLSPFDRPELEAVVFRSGDLPPEWAAGQSYEGMVGDPDLRRFSVRRDLGGPGMAGEVSVGLYHSEDGAVEALVSMLKATSTGAVEAIAIGDAGFVGRGNLQFHQGRCLVLLELDAVDQTRDLLVHYGRRLDDRLRILGC